MSPIFLNDERLFWCIHDVFQPNFEISNLECSTRKLSGGSYVGSWQEAVYKIREINPGDPVRPFFRGCWARVITAAPGCALSWLAYEFMKTLLNSENSQQRVDTSISGKRPSEFRNNHLFSGENENAGYSWIFLSYWVFLKPFFSHLLLASELRRLQFLVPNPATITCLFVRI